MVFAAHDEGSFSAALWVTRPAKRCLKSGVKWQYFPITGHEWQSCCLNSFPFNSCHQKSVLKNMVLTLIEPAHLLRLKAPAAAILGVICKDQTRTPK